MNLIIPFPRNERALYHGLPNEIRALLLEAVETGKPLTFEVGHGKHHLNVITLEITRGLPAYHVYVRVDGKRDENDELYHLAIHKETGEAWWVRDLEDSGESPIP